MFTTSLGLVLGIAALTPAVPVDRAAADTACIVTGMAVEGRRSPLDSLTFTVGGSPVKVCYGRPSARGRTMIGGEAVPYGHVWRTGANEPTMIHATAPILVAGIQVPAGTYSLYTVPGETTWDVIVNRSTSQWGAERNYTEEVRAQELGRATVPGAGTEQHIEQFTMRAEPAEGGATLVLEWERTRVRIPIRRG